MLTIALVDWDPGGYHVAPTLMSQRARSRVCVAEPLCLIRPEVFSAEEV